MDMVRTVLHQAMVLMAEQDRWFCVCVCEALGILSELYTRQMVLCVCVKHWES